MVRMYDLGGFEEPETPVPLTNGPYFIDIAGIACAEIGGRAELCTPNPRDGHPEVHAGGREDASTSSVDRNAKQRAVPNALFAQSSRASLSRHN